MAGKKSVRGWLWIAVAVVAVLGVLNDDDDDPRRQNLSPPTDRSVQTPAVAPRTLYVEADTLNVRSAPTTTATVLLKVVRGTTVQPTHQSGAWYGMPLTDGSIGWVHGDYLTTSVIAPLQQPAAQAAPTYDRAAVVEAIIALSIAMYDGPCPCPYNSMRNGRSCGGNSAYSKPGGASPICFPQQVTQQMIEDHLARN